MTNKKYDYIIAGGGCAGLSLAYRMAISKALANKKVLIIDQVQKNKNDRTWCFWEKEKGVFDSIIHHTWDFLVYKDHTFKKKMKTEPFQYKMIKSLDFYHFILSELKKSTQFNFCVEEICSIEVEKGKAKVKTDKSNYKADYVFNSTALFYPQMPKEKTFIQHFMGWEIEADHEVFDLNIGTLMDFDVPQEKGATFVYVLPTSKQKALVEYTYFTKEVLDKSTYEERLSAYIKNVLKLQDYSITHKEYGEIPMSKAIFPKHYKEKVIHLGTAGGYTKASSGYTFQFIQKHTQEIVGNLEQALSPVIESSFADKRYDWYDKTMLEVLLSEKMDAREFFGNIFRNSIPETIFAFMSNQSTWFQDISIMKSLPILTFAKAGVKEM